MKKVTVPFFISHQGCPHTCVFCDQRTISGSSGNLPSTNDILSKVDSWRRTAGERQLEVAFFGGTFTALPVSVQDKLLHPLQTLLASGEIRSIRISTRPDCIDDATVTRLAGQGVTVIELGVQSMDDGVLERSGRGHTAADSDAAIHCIRNGGLAVGAQLMPGLPGDTSVKSIQSLNRVIAAGAAFIRLYPVVVLRGTELARRFQTGEFSPLSVDQGVQLCKVLLHESMKAAIPVIRIGLQADDGLNADTVLAGCRHPALGQLVRSELYFDLLCQLVEKLPDGQPCSIRCHPSRVSDVAGPGRANLTRLAGRMLSARIVPEPVLMKEEIVLETLNNSIKGNIITGLNYTRKEE